MTRTIKKRSRMGRPDPALREKRAGYVDCGCRDCFEIAIGVSGDMCHECEDAGCEPHSECKVEREGE